MHLPRHRRRLRPEDHAVPRGTDRRRAGPRAATARCAGARSAAKTCWPPRMPASKPREVRAAVDADGRITALSLRDRSRISAPTASIPPNYLLRMAVLSLTGPYRIADYACDMKVVLTNKCGAAPMRAPMSIASWVMDGTHRGGGARAGARSDRGAPPQHADRGGAALDHARGAGAGGRDAARDAGRRAGRVRRAGVPRAPGGGPGARRVSRHGRCAAWWKSNTYGSAFYRAAGIPGSGHEAGWVKVAPTGAVDVSVGLMGSGQGYETALAQAAAEGLGVPIDSVRAAPGQHRHRALRHGQPRRARRHRRQFGAAAGRADAAAQDVRDRRGVARAELGRRVCGCGRAVCSG